MKSISHLGQKILLRKSIDEDIPNLRKLVNEAYYLNTLVQIVGARPNGVCGGNLSEFTKWWKVA